EEIISNIKRLHQIEEDSQEKIVPYLCAIRVKPRSYKDLRGSMVTTGRTVPGPVEHDKDPFCESVLT
ncbi:MAG: hypothetical protein ABIF71_07125, partial [Planctomycetota bacterium]